ncbi:MAG: hypothetical protein PHV36_07220 [Elusimicrobiales bacterium]|nr:hypothetical protein [Elusimicrobiales bacterium]
MKNLKLHFMLTGLILCLAAASSFAQEKPGEEKKLEAVAAELDKNHSEGQQRVADMIKAEFGVADGLIMGLRFKKLGYGEIAIALGLAQGLHRTIKDEDLYKIVSLRQGPPVMGWGRIAKELGLKLGPVISKVQKISAEVRRDEKGDKAAEDKKTEAEKLKKQEKADKSEKTDKDGKAWEQKKSWMERMKSFMRR